ncbi:hypothetical protein FHX37_3136 [Haloactinospora alba]|uniref:Uncharacterized protein n=1 Tax=Haloactinospora alba TaxID=405555 RepID=A0A543NMW4_9ACTN|nr:hypothetical protein [Haloactinospora alba]TQN33137.1 hypothetical protein FHX37_3136 [Haloactinospora alba]
MRSENSTFRNVLLSLASAGAIVTLGGCGLLPGPLGPPPEKPDSDDSSEDSSSQDSGSDDSSTDESSSTDYRTGEIPASMPEFDDTDFPAEPGESAPVTEKIQWEVLHYTNEYGMKHDPDSTAKCDETDGSIDETITCDVTYGGKDVEYTVDIEGGETFFNYEYEADRIPLSREAVEAGYRWHTDSRGVLCDMSEYELVSPGETGITCEADTSTGVRTSTVELGQTAGLLMFHSV